MPSTSLNRWQLDRSDELDEIIAAHSAVGGSGRGRRYATQQINHAFVMLLSSHFQGFCRDLYGESLDAFARCIQPPTVVTLIRADFSRDLKLLTGNPNPGNIGSDFGRLGIEFWKEVKADSPLNEKRQSKLEELNRWRNAIAHQDFDRVKLYPRHLFPFPPTTTEVQLTQVKDWRSACNGLSKSFDEVLYSHLKTITGTIPW